MVPEKENIQRVAEEKKKGFFDVRGQRSRLTVLRPLERQQRIITTVKCAELCGASNPVEGKAAVAGSCFTPFVLGPVPFYCCPVWSSPRTLTSQRLKGNISACKAARLWCEAAHDVRGALGQESESRRAAGAAALLPSRARPH